MKALMTLQELSAETGYPVNTLYQLCAPTGDLPVIRTHPGPSAKRKTRGRIRVRREDWLAWVDRHRTVPRSEAIAAAVERETLRDLPGVNRYVS